MIGSNLQPATVVTRHINATVAGTTAVNGIAAIDMQGFDGVEFIALIGTLTAGQVTSLKAQGSADGSTNWTDLTGAVTANMADGDSNKILRLEVFRPTTFPRYLRAVVNRATQNAVVDGVIAVQYSCKKLPVTQDATVSQNKFVQSP